MDETTTKLLEAIQALGAELRTEVADSMAKIAKRCDALDEKIAKKSNDDGGDPDSTMATRTAADSVSRAEFEATRDQLRALQVAQPARQSSATRDQMADAQAKADVAYRSLGESAPQPMSGEGHFDYLIRLHRPLQKHSKKFKAAELHVLARDPSTLNSVLDQIRADAVEVGISPVGMPEFQHRMVTQQLPTGHTSRTFVGNGTIFKMLSRPVRHVQSIGADPRYPRSGGGAVFAAQ